MTLLHMATVKAPLAWKNMSASLSAQLRPSDARALGSGSTSAGGALTHHRRSSAGAEISGTGPHILTIALEDYYQVGAFNHVIQRGQWYRFERRIEYSTNRTLDLLDQFHARATFFVLGWIADIMPELVRQVTARGHEIASKGYYHRNIGQLTPAEFRDDLARARESLERAGGNRILGYRVADSWFQPNDLWALDVLAEEGYEYDSSIGPILRTYHAEPWRRFAHLAPLRRADPVGAADFHRRCFRVSDPDRRGQLLPPVPAPYGPALRGPMGPHVYRALRDVLPHLGARSGSAQDQLRVLVFARAAIS